LLSRIDAFAFGCLVLLSGLNSGQKRLGVFAFAILVSLICLTGSPAQAESVASVTVVELHQRACQFVEPEGADKHYSATTYQACADLNARNGAQRVAASSPLKLASGHYIFRVYNDNVPYNLGFWLRGSGFARVTLPSVSGGGIGRDSFREYSIELSQGEYRYSCPLNPTPDYILRVE